MANDAHAIWVPKTDEHERAFREAQESCVLLRPSPRRFVLFPIQHHQIWEHYKLLEHSFWTAEDFDVDLAAFSCLTDAARTRICSLVDAHLYAAQQLRLSGIVDAFAGELQAAEARCYFGFQGMIENIHIEALSSTVLRLQPLCLNVPPRVVVNSVEPLLEACTSPEHSFTRRLLVYAATLYYYRSCTLAASRSLELELPSLAALFARLARDLDRCCDFANLLCRMIVPSQIFGSPWLIQLLYNTAAACARTFPNLSVQSDIHYNLAEAFCISLSNGVLSPHSRSTDGTPAFSPPLTPQPQKESEGTFVFVTDVDF
ncbi:hypothetical protein EXIGLDRAFT_761482 [Exidia glandulosa HHB12029]|uniref:Uncharacterized protein n=1 Tax=Exidia glandulosa HHB12029 TaxID=1314781 RepID=A0A165NFG5_EXIGL|nr:hypothetical protein EXIGLDRAFT_761482 [Exidia glandulosa HHB12029]